MFCLAVRTLLHGILLIDEGLKIYYHNKFVKSNTFLNLIIQYFQIDFKFQIVNFKFVSRIGKKFIEIPPAVKIEMQGNHIKVVGPKGELARDIHSLIKTELKDGRLLVAPKNELSKKQKGLWGLYRALIFNMVEGVEKGFQKKLEIEGVGYKAAVQGEELVLNVGFVNPVRIKKPTGITFTVEKNVITVAGIDKEIVGQIAAEIRKSKKAEPYKGKGIKYEGEKIRRKEGKKVVVAK